LNGIFSHQVSLGVPKMGRYAPINGLIKRASDTGTCSLECTML